MPLITDRDLVVREPSLFVNAADGAGLIWSATDGVVSGVRLTSASSDFMTLGIDVGHAVVINNVACEVVSCNSPSELSVSLPRSLMSDPTIEPAPGSAQPFKLWTFKRLSDLAEAWALGALGIDENDPLKPLVAADVVDLDALKHLIALRTIHQAFAIAAAIWPTNTSLKDRTALYAQRLSEARQHTKVLLKLDADGEADAARRLDVVTFVRN